jgi:signal transduction histidine kinase
MGLHACLEWHFDRYTRQTGIQVQFSEDGLGEKRFPADVEITVFRIIQEALTNIARHAKVREARVDFTVHENEILIRIEDQGKGFNVHTLEVEYASVGLGGMRERTNLVGGKLEIYSAPERGTLITAHIPTKKIIERRKHARNRNPG